MFCLICCLIGFFNVKNLFFKIPNTHSISFLVLSTEVDQFPIGPASCCLHGQARNSHSLYPPSQRSQAPWLCICLPSSSTHVHSIIDSGWPAWESKPWSISNTSIHMLYFYHSCIPRMLAKRVECASGNCRHIQRPKLYCRVSWTTVPHNVHTVNQTRTPRIANPLVRPNHGSKIFFCRRHPNHRLRLP